MSNPSRAQAQDQIKTVAGATGQREWTQAFLPFAAKAKYPATVIALAWALFEFHFSRKTGECDPGIDALAAETGINVRTVRRVFKRLKDDGWLQVRQMGNGENAQVDFTISARTTTVRPAARTTAVLPADVTARPNSTVSPAKFGHQPGQYGGLPIRTLNTEHIERASGARSADVDAPVSTRDNPKISSGSAPAGAPDPSDIKRDAIRRFFPNGDYGPDIEIILSSITSNLNGAATLASS